jgi:serine/threonine-protein kinase
VDEKINNLETDSLLGHYRILKKIGAGGMGEVYLAEDTRLRRKIALKVLPEKIAQDKDRLRRFEQEAHAASALNHPNILTIYEIGKTDDTRYIATEFIDGETLRDKLERDEISLKEILNVAEQTAFALSAAHAAGIVHRDLKPENIMIRRDGIVKVLDFGLAKLTEKRIAGVDAEAETRAQVNTQAGMILGTVRYMSPEQARGKDIDERTDVWSLGVCLYEMLTGQQPFSGETTNDTIAAILTKEPKLLDENLPSELQRIVRKTLQKDADKRYQTAKDLLIDLEDVKEELKFQSKLERTFSPNREETKTQILNATTTDVAHTTSSAEYIANEIKNHKSGFVIGLMVLLLASIGLGYWFFSNRTTSAAQIESIAVLPFVNESSNADIEYLSDGMTESVINNLTKLPNLRVISRNSVFRYKGKETDAAKVGQELNVRSVLTGRVVQRGDNLIISAELTDLQDNKQIWGQQYNRKTTDAFALQQEISRDISETLRTKLTGEEQQRLAKRETVSSEAYQLYLKGRYHWNKREEKEYAKALEYFQQAIDKDPTYALAYVGLAETYLIGGSFNLSRWEKVSKAKAAAQKALEIDPTLGEAYTTLANTKHHYDWNFAEAEKEYKRAIELSPNYPTAHHWYAESLTSLGRFDESFAEYNRALELDPLSLAISTDLGMAYYYNRQYDRAIEHFKKLIELDPKYVRTHYYLADVYQEKGMFEETIAEIEKGSTLQGYDMKQFTEGKTKVQTALKKLGARGYFQQVLDFTKEEEKKGTPVDSISMATSYARLGENNEAFKWLEKAFEERKTDLVWLKVEPKWDNIRLDPRFADLVKRVGLP